jgi:hypothetical protein
MLRARRLAIFGACLLLAAGLAQDWLAGQDPPTSRTRWRGARQSEHVAHVGEILEPGVLCLPRWGAAKQSLPHGAGKE